VGRGLLVARGRDNGLDDESPAVMMGVAWALAARGVFDIVNAEKLAVALGGATARAP
jgi:hypothetical protein